MNKLLRLRLVFGSAAALAFGAIAYAADQEAPKGSIRPTGEVKPAKFPALAKITFQQSLAAALQAALDSVIQGELEFEDSALMSSFCIVGADKRISEVEIEAGNGKVLDMEREEDEKPEEKG